MYIYIYSTLIPLVHLTTKLTPNSNESWALPTTERPKTSAKIRSESSKALSVLTSGRVSSPLSPPYTTVYILCYTRYTAYIYIRDHACHYLYTYLLCYIGYAVIMLHILNMLTK